MISRTRSDRCSTDSRRSVADRSPATSSIARPRGRSSGSSTRGGPDRRRDPFRGLEGRQRIAPEAASLLSRTTWADSLSVARGHARPVAFAISSSPPRAPSTASPRRLPVTEATPIATADVRLRRDQADRRADRARHGGVEVPRCGRRCFATSIRSGPTRAHGSASCPSATRRTSPRSSCRARPGLRGPVQIYGDDWSTPDGTCIRDYIHVVDLAEAHVASLDFMAAPTAAPMVEVLNVGTGRGTSVREALEAFERATGQKVAIHRRAAPRRRHRADLRLRRQVGPPCSAGARPATLDDAMRDAWRWQTDPDPSLTSPTARSEAQRPAVDVAIRASGTPRSATPVSAHSAS